MRHHQWPLQAVLILIFDTVRTPFAACFCHGYQPRFSRKSGRFVACGMMPVIILEVVLREQNKFEVQIVLQVKRLLSIEYVVDIE